MSDLFEFVQESNRIEGIDTTLDADIMAHREFLSQTVIGVKHIEAFVTAIQPGAVLRDRPGLNVRVGEHIPPPGGAAIRGKLVMLLAEMNRRIVDPYDGHVRYETLHPFTDGNGRSGRALWLWQMVRGEWGTFDFPSLPRTFLHQFYYQTLERSRS